MRNSDIKQFRKTVWDYYYKNKRPMPWRDDISPYSVFISEVMLQQTQVSRVVAKYSEFMTAFPNFASLAKADTKRLLRVWQGMGYNRRALYLRYAAQVIVDKYKELLPNDVALLDELPGIGYATASSIAAFAFNLPVVFIETNIRRVFIHHFFTSKSSTNKVHDDDIFPIVKKVVDKKNPREWYWALMDYGAYLGETIPNPNKKSKHYIKQPQFIGSVRQLRGQILRLLLKKSYTLAELHKLYPNDDRVDKALSGLIKEGMIRKENTIFYIQ